MTQGHLDDGTTTRASDTSAIEQALAALEKLTLEDLRPGDFLPSEAKLASMVGVSRLTIREATRSLVAKGYLEIRQGRRPLVLQPNGSLLSDYFSGAVRRDRQALLELLEVRMALEVHAARLACAGATKDHLAAMAEAVREMDAALADEQAFHTADVRFHEALADASGNGMVRQIIEELAEPLMHSRRESYRGHRRSGEDLRRVVDQHRAVLDAVRDRDDEAAGEAMRAHLGSTARDLRVALAADRGDGGQDDGVSASA